MLHQLYALRMAASYPSQQVLLLIREAAPAHGEVQFPAFQDLSTDQRGQLGATRELNGPSSTNLVLSAGFHAAQSLLGLYDLVPALTSNPPCRNFPRLSQGTMGESAVVSPVHRRKA